MREGSRFVRGMYAWVGFRQVGVPYRRDARLAGETKYPVKKMIRLASDGVIGFSRVPLRIALKLGALAALLSIVGGMAVLALKLLGDFTVPGWTSILLAVCFLGGLQLAFLGVLGQYIGRTYEESLGRPLYVVSHLHGVQAPLEPPRRAVIAEPSTLAAVLGEVVLTGELEVQDVPL
jgi:dolichol-phosphate mannosyltransferase